MSRISKPVDETLSAICHKYGKQTLPQPHPCLKDPIPVDSATLTREGFKDPRFRVRPVFRQCLTQKDGYFDN